MIVVDACTVISWVLEDERSADADAALDTVAREGALIPGNFISEVTNALLRAERRGRTDDITAGMALSEILELPLTVESPDPHTMLALARVHALTCYDSAYLALALQAQLPLATVDRALRQAAQRAACAWQQ